MTTARVTSVTRAVLCSPEGIRTLATALRGRRPRPLDDGARTCSYCRCPARTTVPNFTRLSSTGAPCGHQPLGYQDSNLD